jgi:diacylglycerol kinase family enzyme
MKALVILNPSSGDGDLVGTTPVTVDVQPGSLAVLAAPDSIPPGHPAV